MVSLPVLVQPFASLTNVVYVPAAKPLNTLVLCAAPPLMLYIYGAVPPLPFSVMLPLLLVAQLGFANTLPKLNAAGAVINALVVAVQPFASVTVSV